MKIRLTKDGYDEYFKEIDNLKAELVQISKKKREAIESAPGDGWHDNFPYDEAVREEDVILTRIENMIKNVKNIEVINSNTKKIDIINVGDTVKLELKYDEDDIEIEMFKLIGGIKPNTEGTIKEISLNSPLGKVIYQSKINSRVNYKVDDRTIDVYIIEKID